MRIDIPQEFPRRRESSPGLPKPEVSGQQAHPILRRTKTLEERAREKRLNQAPPRRAPSRSVPQERETRTHRVKSPRDATDEQRTQRNTIPSQTIGMRFRAEERTLMLELGRFRVIRTNDLADSIYEGKVRKLDEDLRYLRSKGLIETRLINLRRDGKRRHIDRAQVATLTKDGRAWLGESGEVPKGQTVYDGFVKPREISHDSLIYRAYRDAAVRIENNGGSNLRVKLDFEIKADMQKDLHRARKTDPKRDLTKIKREVAEKHDLPFINEKIQIPDARIEFERKVDDSQSQESNQGSRVGGHEDIEVLTATYRRGYLRSKAQAGFRVYAFGADRSSITAKIEDDHNMMREILNL